MVKGVLFAVVLAWLAVAQPNLTLDSNASPNSAAINSAHQTSPLANASATQVPEPSTLISLTFGVGLLGGVLLRLRSSR